MISSQRPLVLGSASPRRRDILSALGVPTVVFPRAVPEDPLPGETPGAYLERIAAAKLRGVWERLREEGLPGQATAGGLLVADTIVVIDEEILGKPLDVADARRILGGLVGRTHTVFTRYLVGAAVAMPPAAESAGAGPVVLAARTVRTEVKLRAATEREVAAYAATGEGLDKAGAYAAQGIGAFLVERLDGSYSNVVGLPACELIADLCRVGLLDAFPRAVSEL